MKWMLLSLPLLALGADAGRRVPARPPEAPPTSRAEDLPLAKKLKLLKKGDPRVEIERVLGRPAEEWGADDFLTGGVATTLAYPNPAAPPDLPPDLRRSLVYLDRDGRLLFIHERSWGC